MLHISAKKDGVLKVEDKARSGIRVKAYMATSQSSIFSQAKGSRLDIS